MDNDNTAANQPQETAPVHEPSIFDSPEWTATGGDSAAAPGEGYVGIRFQPVGKVYHYLNGGLSVKVGNWVVVDTPRGKQMGQVATVRPPRQKGDAPFKRIERLATGRDMALRHYYETRELEALIACRAESSALRLPIKVVRAEYGFDGQTLTFLFSTDQEERVETGDLRQAMSRLYRARIELRQISPREVAKVLGGMGACGISQRCCSRFLTDFSPISIKHAKEQNLSLNPHDITGMCGRLRCCLVYEFEQYVEARRHLPKRNAIIGTPMGQAKVVEVLPMQDSVVVRVGEGDAAKEYEFHREQLTPLEELKRLQDKAAGGECDKHEGGACDCGKNVAPAAGTNAPAEAAPAPGAPGAQMAETRSRKRRKKKGGSSAPPPPSQPADRKPRGPAGEPPAGPPDAEGAPEAPESAAPGAPRPPDRPLRRPLRPRRPAPAAPNRPPDGAPAPQAAPDDPAPGGSEAEA